MNSCALLPVHNSNNNSKPSKHKVTGGYSSSKKVSAEDWAMFDKAVRSIRGYTDIKPLSVATQVVSGTNYKFSCSAKDKSGRVVKGEVIIYKPLPHTGKEPSVTNYKF